MVVGLDRGVNYYKIQMALAYIKSRNAMFIVRGLDALATQPALHTLLQHTSAAARAHGAPVGLAMQVHECKRPCWAPVPAGHQPGRLWQPWAHC